MPFGKRSAVRKKKPTTRILNAPDTKRPRKTMTAAKSVTGEVFIREFLSHKEALEYAENVKRLGGEVLIGWGEI